LAFPNSHSLPLYPLHVALLPRIASGHMEAWYRVYLDGLSANQFFLLLPHLDPVSFILVDLYVQRDNDYLSDSPHTVPLPKWREMLHGGKRYTHTVYVLGTIPSMKAVYIGGYWSYSSSLTGSAHGDRQSNARARQALFRTGSAGMECICDKSLLCFAWDGYQTSTNINRCSLPTLTWTPMSKAGLSTSPGTSASSIVTNPMGHVTPNFPKAKVVINTAGNVCISVHLHLPHCIINTVIAAEKSVNLRRFQALADPSVLLRWGILTWGRSWLGSLHRIKMLGSLPPPSLHPHHQTRPALLPPSYPRTFQSVNPCLCRCTRMEIRKEYDVSLERLRNAQVKSMQDLLPLRRPSPVRCLMHRMTGQALPLPSLQVPPRPSQPNDKNFVPKLPRMNWKQSSQRTVRTRLTKCKWILNHKMTMARRSCSALHPPTSLGPPTQGWASTHLQDK